MKTRHIVFLGAVLLLFGSCVPESQVIDSIIPKSGKLAKVTAYLDNAPQTKTGLVNKEDGGKSVVWKSGNSISVFYNSGTAGGSKFTTSTNGPIAEFLGNIPTVSGDLSGVGGQAFFWGLYPYNETASCDGTAITTTLPANQLAYQGDVADDLLVTVGRSENLSIHFKNACSVIGFTLTQENISKVVFSGNAGEKVAGEFKISFDGSNKLVDTPTENAVESITITPAESETFQTGVAYYFATLPGTFSEGYSLAFTKADASEATYQQPSAITLKASTFYTMARKDEGLIFTLDPLYEAIDLGLSVKWAACNLGASLPNEYGEYYSWAETVSKSNYINATYKWGDLHNLSKYCNNENYGIVDNLSVIKQEDDAASVQWGSGWRIPTIDEFNELLNNCTWEWTSDYNGTSASGFIGTSKISGYTDKSIFLPAGGCMLNEEIQNVGEFGIYWLSQNSSEYPTEGWGFLIKSSQPALNYWTRYEGNMIRPVLGNRISVKSLSLNKVSAEIGVGQKLQLTVNFLPSNVPEKGIIWSSSNDAVATVSQTGQITAIARGDCTITATSTDNGVCADCAVTVGTPEPIDLGLSVKWAATNVGALSLDEYGEFFSWGDITPYSTYGQNNPWITNSKLTKYCTQSGSGLNGFVDNKAILDPEDDIVHRRFGGKWRMPTKEEFDELIDNSKCTWEWKKINNKSGYLVTSISTGESIFLPRGGKYYKMSSLSGTDKGFYWSSMISSSCFFAHNLTFSSTSYSVATNSRDDALAVRPVYDESIIPVQSVVLDHDNAILSLGESLSLYATVIPGNATYKESKCWSSSDESVASVNKDGLITTYKVGQTTITVDMGGGITAHCLITVKYKVPEYVDLGLSKKWASFNLGATKPEEMGYLFAWGEVEPKDVYQSNTYKWSNGGTFEGAYTKYCNDPNYGVDNYVDEYTYLLQEDDAASNALGSGWSMPSYDDLEELRRNCDWEWSEENGVAGVRVTSKINTNSIFLPTVTSNSSSSAQYWSLSLEPYSYPYNASYLSIYHSSSYDHFFVGGSWRYLGMYIRPVYSTN